MKNNRNPYRIIFGLLAGFFLFSAVAAKPDTIWRPRLQITLPATATTLAYSPDGTGLAVGHPSGRLTVWDTRTGKLQHSFDAHRGKVESVVFMPQGDQLITLGRDRRLRFWSVNDWSEQGSIEGVAFAFNVSPDGRWLVAQDIERAIWLWDLKTLTNPVQLSKSVGKGVPFFPCTAAVGIYLVCPYGLHPYFVDPNTKEEIEIPVSDGESTKAEVIIKILEKFLAENSLEQMRDDISPSYQMIPSPVYPIVALSRRSTKGFVDVWNLIKKETVVVIKLPKDSSLHQVLKASFSYDGVLIAVGGKFNLTVWEIANGKQIAMIKGNGQILFSPQKNELCVTNDKTLFIYEPN